MEAAPVPSPSAPAPPERQLRLTFLLVTVATVLASAAALVMQAPDYDALDLTMLPAVSAVFIVTCVLYLRRLISGTRALTLGFTAYTLYLLLAYHHQFNVHVPRYGALSENTYWFAALFMGAYLSFPPRQAARVSLAVLLYLLLISGYHLLSGSPEPDRRVVAQVAQFLLVCAVMVVMQLRFGTLRDRLMAMRQAAYEDALTGVANRRAAEERLAQLHAAGRVYSLVLFDLDHFKRLNDDHGHATGDRVLRKVAQEAEAAMRGKGLAARWGGEEFVLIFDGPGLPGGAVADTIEALRRQLRQVGGAAGVVGGVTACFGVARAAPGEPPASVLERADAAMYGGKECGRNAVRHAAFETVVLPAPL